ncbi:hypothetical protein [Psychrobacter arcticus]|uniref:hypothetical protein n=1 Tax=Psychrobacter arcticus TaxID=334543 RepID=UPI000039977E|nr:hypothetical protein [Psychrobacter arcticus]
MQGKTDDCPQRLSLVIIAIAWAGGTFATAVLALLALLGNWQNIAMILGSFGASCLLILLIQKALLLSQETSSAVILLLSLL